MKGATLFEGPKRSPKEHGNLHLDLLFSLDPLRCPATQPEAREIRLKESPGRVADLWRQDNALEVGRRPRPETEASESERARDPQARGSLTKKTGGLQNAGGHVSLDPKSVVFFWKAKGKRRSSGEGGEGGRGRAKESQKEKTQF